MSEFDVLLKAINEKYIKDEESICLSMMEGIPIPDPTHDLKIVSQEDLFSMAYSVRAITLSEIRRLDVISEIVRRMAIGEWIEMKDKND